MDEIIAERSARNPLFPALVEAAAERRRLLQGLARERQKAGVSQTAVAARMRTSQSAIARLEAGEIDARISTIGRFASALGKRVEWRVVSGAPRARRLVRPAATAKRR